MQIVKRSFSQGQTKTSKTDGKYLHSVNGDDEGFADVSVLFLFWDVMLIKSASF